MHAWLTIGTVRNQLRWLTIMTVNFLQSFDDELKLTFENSVDVETRRQSAYVVRYPQERLNSYQCTRKVTMAWKKMRQNEDKERRPYCAANRKLRNDRLINSRRE
jgi:hypothetical protein